MESSGEMVAFPLLMTPIETNYRACTIPYRFPSDNPKKATPTELSWINVFLNSVPSFRKRAESDDTVDDAPTRAEKFAERYTEILEDFKKDPESHGGPPDGILLCRIREQVLRELGFRDIFKKVKDEENTKAISLFENVVRLNDGIEDEAKRVENLVRGIFAGNIFDLGSAQLAELFSKDGVSFLASCQNLVARPWVIDDLDNFIMKWGRKSWKKAVIFVDNSGADVILGILPFARELLRRGTQAKLLMSVHHKNLTALVGYCNEGTNIGIIYEYMANGNLEGHLSGRNSNALSWEQRIRIAIDAAEGFEYLHHGCKPPIIHRDVKSTNILLNENLQGKLADFGLSRVIPFEGGTHVATVVAGTPGYLDPEYSNQID